MKKKISIVIPIYNAEKYIDKLLNSILRQTYKDYEVIFVNDGSKDASLDLLKKYAEKYDFIKVVNQKNKGRSEARNNGVKKTTGQYITFVDQDDYISPDFLKQMIENINDNDILLSGFNRVLDDKIIKENIPESTSWSYFKYCATWGKLYKSDFFKEHDLKFYEFNGEDVYLFLNALALTNNRTIINYAGYNNYVNINSITHVINSNKATRSKIKTLLDKIETSDWVNNLNQDDLLDFYLKTIILHLFTQRRILNYKELYNEYNEYFTWLKIACNKRNKKIRLFKQKGEERFVVISINTFVLVMRLHLIKPFLFFFRMLGSNLMKN